MDDFDRDVAGVSALGDDRRRELYRFVTAQSAPVGREQAAKALGMPPHQAKFHLDRLEEAGLLESEYVRLTGRTGPGAGRPAKVYRRRTAEISVSLPAREYAFAGELMAAAIEESASRGTPVADALSRLARAQGERIGATATGSGDPLHAAAATLAGYGYEPRLEDDTLTLANCPFHALAKAHTALVCSMNHAILTGLCSRVGGLAAALEPAEGRCCVVLRGNG